jgi:lipid-A-disaccharide synthase-like uncharacterized protein
MMNVIQPLFELLARFELNFWKVIGLTGAMLFGCRWLVQAHASRKAGRSVVPPVFWLISVVGSLMQLLYFAIYRVDSVGVLSTLPPFLVSGYNCWLLSGKSAGGSAGSER